LASVFTNKKKMATSTTIVTCVEAGPLETQVLMLADTLRAFGGSWAKTDVIAVKPRTGPAISAYTRREFRRLDVEFIDEKFNVELDWWNNANKSSVMSQLEGRVQTPNITWMDSDLIVLKPLDHLVPAPGSRFIARAGEGYLGSNGDDANSVYWRALCALVGVKFDDFEMITSFPELRPIRAYWQAGIYTYEKTTGLGRAHYEILRKLLSGNIGSKSAGIYHQDQVAISLASQKLKLEHSEFRPNMNFNLNPLAKEYAKIIPILDVKILHYHHSFYQQNLGWAMEFLKQLPEDRLELIQRYVPLSSNATTLLGRFHKKALSFVRQRRVDRFKKQIQLY
jgi:hypothetical protein